MTNQKKSYKKQLLILDELEVDEDLACNQETLSDYLTDSRRDVRLSDESDYFNND